MPYHGHKIIRLHISEGREAVFSCSKTSLTMSVEDRGLSVLSHTIPLDEQTENLVTVFCDLAQKRFGGQGLKARLTSSIYRW